MIEIIQRLSFEDVYVYDKRNPIEYLREVNSNILYKIIGFCNTKNLPNYNNFFSNPAIQDEINARVNFNLQRKKSNNYRNRMAK